jgi:hypothetical protein
MNIQGKNLGSSESKEHLITEQLPVKVSHKRFK